MKLCTMQPSEADMTNRKQRKRRYKKMSAVSTRKRQW